MVPLSLWITVTAVYIARMLRRSQHLLVNEGLADDYCGLQGAGLPSNNIPRGKIIEKPFITGGTAYPTHPA